MKVLHFGAGNIGKGLILPVFEASEQFDEIIFVDNDKNTVEYLQEQKNIILDLYSPKDINRIILTKFKIIKSSELFEQSSEWFSEIKMITTSVGKENLNKIKDDVETILNKFKNIKIVMCCENGFRVSTNFKKILSKSYENVNFVDCVIDRIIPLQNYVVEKVLYAEEYYSWIIDAQQWPKTLTKIKGIEYKNDLEFENSKKLCLLNGVHCALAWYRFNVDNFSKISTVALALKDNQTKRYIKEYIYEVAQSLSQGDKKSFKELMNFGKTTLKRFSNKKIDDDLVRVGRNPITKLKINERILLPLTLAFQNKTTSELILKTFKNGINYWCKEDNESLKMKNIIIESGVKILLKDELFLGQNIVAKLIEQL